MNWNTNRLKMGGESMFQRLGRGQSSKKKGTVVLLAHDIAFRPHEITGGGAEATKLAAFLRMAVDAGYRFDTLDFFWEERPESPPKVDQREEGLPSQVPIFDYPEVQPKLLAPEHVPQRQPELAPPVRSLPSRRRPASAVDFFDDYYDA